MVAELDMIMYLTCLVF